MEIWYDIKAFENPHRNLCEVNAGEAPDGNRRLSGTALFCRPYDIKSDSPLTVSHLNQKETVANPAES